MNPLTLVCASKNLTPFHEMESMISGTFCMLCVDVCEDENTQHMYYHMTTLSPHHTTSHDLTLSLRQASSVDCVPRTLKTSTLPRYWEERREGGREVWRERSRSLPSILLLTNSIHSAYLCMVANFLTNEGIVRVLPALWGEGALTVAMATHVSLGLTGSAHRDTSGVLSAHCLLCSTRQRVRSKLSATFNVHMITMRRFII